MKRFVLFVWAAGCTLLLAGSPARADLIAWSEHWDQSPNFIPASGHGNGGLLLTGGNVSHNILGSSELIAANVMTFSHAPDRMPQTFNAAPFSLILFIRDKDSGINGAVTFTGVFDGTVSSHSADVTMTLTSPASQTLHLGRHLYDVTLDHFSPPGPPGSHQSGAISAKVNVTHNPEPSTLVLAGLGLPLLAAAARRRRPS